MLKRYEVTELIKQRSERSNRLAPEVIILKGLANSNLKIDALCLTTHILQSIQNCHNYENY